ncbi:hypothetical protein LTR53_007452 [Teratosphaeriaceae sp. CCFEE 6253]|nr:hypothetical protein LTR53_007452 [Teratosphaeriaceae sp. CCFEE 6253]
MAMPGREVWTLCNGSLCSTVDPPSETSEKVHADVSEIAADRLTLFSLPAELRNEIYRLVLVSPHPLDIFDYGPTTEDCVGASALLVISQQVRQECLPIMYGGNIFTAVAPCYVPRFLMQLPTSKAKLIKHVRPFGADALPGVGCIAALDGPCWVRDWIDRFEGKVRPEAFVICIKIGEQEKWRRLLPGRD